MQDLIVVKGARLHNLKGIDVELPRNKLIVITGPSGSGKSSLTFDTIYAESQRRYMETLSASARQLLQQFEKPDVDYIEGLSPSIAIDQKIPPLSSRSTVGTITGIYDYLRVMYARIGEPTCFKCGKALSKQGVDEIIEKVMSLPEKTKIQILSPVVKGRKGEHKKELESIRRKGFIKVRIDGVVEDLSRECSLDPHKRHDIEAVVDRLIIKDGIEKRLRSGIELGLKLSSFIIINILDRGEDLIFSKKLTCQDCGVSYPEIDANFFSFNSPYGACPACGGSGEDIGGDPCGVCLGYRIRKEALGVKIGGIHIGEFSQYPFTECLRFIEHLILNKHQRSIAERILKGFREKLSFLVKIGVGYLSMNRPINTLSGGEYQRVRIATQMGTSLSGVLYIMDEPSIGLHPVDCSLLLDCLCGMRDMENTVVVVEHDEGIMRSADYIVDMGPGAGSEGGRVVAEGSVEEIVNNADSITGAYLRGELEIPLPLKRRNPNGFITIRGASEHNLKNIDVMFPVGVLTCVTGVSGSGKSTLIYDILYKILSNKLYRSSEKPGKYESIEGIEELDRVINIDQSPLGRTPRSNPATYMGIFTIIRNLFSKTPEARLRGYTPARFSFNVSGGRCEECKGDGVIKVSMHFLPDVYITCQSCEGKRYNKETLSITYKGKNIDDVLNMTVSEALDFFYPIGVLREKLSTLERVGLGYITLGQPATTLSGGEAQRLKISKELSKKGTSKTLYLLDEPTTGLHFEDVRKLLSILNELVDRGSTVIIIEHHIDVIKSADYIIDMGPGGGPDGGNIVAKGTPEEVAEVESSLTGRFLREKLFPFSSLSLS